MTKEIDDGVIKFNYTLDQTYSLEERSTIEIEKIRSKLYQRQLIGEYLPQEIGFGNISYRLNGSSFIISGTQTGKYKDLGSDKYTLVESCDLETMTVKAKGLIAPSSESLTHFAIYTSVSNINCILHIHNASLWNLMLSGQNYIKTKKDINYGTTEMAHEAKRCIHKNKSGIFVMSGHEDGIIAYGETKLQAYQEILNLIQDSGIQI